MPDHTTVANTLASYLNRSDSLLHELAVHSDRINAMEGPNNTSEVTREHIDELRQEAARLRTALRELRELVVVHLFESYLGDNGAGTQPVSDDPIEHTSE